jgi:hypothetical protein
VCYSKLHLARTLITRLWDIGGIVTSKRELIRNEDIVKAGALQSYVAHPVCATCNSCKQVWAARSWGVINRFMFVVPGSWEAFVCPECRKLVW